MRETFLTTRATSLRGLGSCWGSVPGGSPGAGQGREEQSVISSGPIKIPAGQRRPVLPRCFIHGRPGSTNKPGLSCCPLCSVPAEPGTAEREWQSGAGASPPGVRELLWHQCSGCSPSPSSGQAGSAPGSAILSQFLWWHLSICGSGQAHSVRTRDSACSQQREKATANKAIVEEPASVPADRF